MVLFCMFGHILYLQLIILIIKGLNYYEKIVTIVSGVVVCMACLGCSTYARGGNGHSPFLLGTAVDNPCSKW